MGHLKRHLVVQKGRVSNGRKPSSDIELIQPF